MEKKIEDLNHQASLVKADLGFKGIKSYSDLNEMNLNLNPNTLKFKKQENETIYQQTLLQTDQKLEGQLKFNIYVLAFYFCYICLLCLAVNVYNFIVNQQNQIVNFVQMVILVFFIIVAIIILFPVVKFPKVRKKSIFWLTLLMTLLQVFLLVLDKNVIKCITNEAVQSQLNHSMILVATFYVTSYTLLSTHMGLTFICFLSWVLYVITSAFQEEQLITTVCNILTFGFIAFLFAFNGYRNDKLMRALFLISKSNEKQTEFQPTYFTNELMDDTSMKKLKTIINKQISNKFEDLTEMDIILLTLHRVMDILSRNTQFIIYTDIKNQLEQAQSDIQRTLKTLLSKNNLFEVNIEKKFRTDLDFTEQDKLFISEQC